MKMKKGINSLPKNESEVSHRPPYELVLEAVITLCHAKSGDNKEAWPSTRDIAEKCCLGIYKTRYLLLKIVANGQVTSSSQRIKNSLRWYPLIGKGDG
ncbi:FaeA/PapI family transcriptional regulator [Serratia marcescens]|uniref:FaeA/PapI family transcriptional regulator n=1 Tax=Serratia marcescens TaxID=615 RepID=UPI003EE1F45F